MAPLPSQVPVYSFHTDQESPSWVGELDEGPGPEYYVRFPVAQLKLLVAEACHLGYSEPVDYVSPLEKTIKMVSWYLIFEPFPAPGTDLFRVRLSPSGAR